METKGLSGARPNVEEESSINGDNSNKIGVTGMQVSIEKGQKIMREINLIRNEAISRAGRYARWREKTKFLTKRRS